jgi:branched-chain amino acid transport system permease protein
MLTVSNGKARILTRQMLVFFVLLFSYPLWASEVGLYGYLGVEIAIFILYATGYNLLLGYTGLPSFGHGAFLGVGAYAYGLSQLHLFDSLVLGLIFATLAGALVSGFVACFLAHRRGIYFALMTIAFGQVAWFIALKWHSVTGGEDGMLNVFRPQFDLGFVLIDLRENFALYYLVAVLLALVLVLLWRLVHSPFGTALQAIRMNETRARFVGYRVWLVKWTVFSLSGAIAGLAGGLFCLAQESAYPDVMSLHASGFVVMMTLVGGGFVSFWGPVVGAIVFFLARDLLGSITETWLLWYGLLFMGVMLYEPEGIAGAWGKLLARIRARNNLTVAESAESNR